MKGLDRWLTSEPEEACFHEGVECELPCECNCDGCYGTYLGEIAESGGIPNA